MRRLLPLLLTPLLTLPAIGCSALAEEEDDGVEIVASFYPMQYAAERVSGGDVEILTTPGAEPHDFELTIKETAMVADADLVVFEHGFQPAVDATIEENAGGEVVDAAEVVDLMALEEHAHEDEHGHGGVDPHFWLDPILMADLGDAVADRLVELDPGHEDVYRDNAADLRRDMQELEQEYLEGLSNCDRDLVVVSHDAFGYLERFGLHLEPIAGLSPDAEPTPAHLAQLQELATEEGVTTVFAETLGSSKMADTLARDLGLRTSTLDPIEGISEPGSEDYVSLMRRNLANLREANGCR